MRDGNIVIFGCKGFKLFVNAFLHIVLSFQCDINSELCTSVNIFCRSDFPLRIRIGSLIFEGLGKEAAIILITSSNLLPFAPFMVWLVFRAPFLKFCEILR